MGSQQHRQRATDTLKWALVVVTLLITVVINLYFAHFSSSLRLLANIILIALALLVAMQTAKGQKAWGYIKTSRDELIKVVWPTPQMTLQVTLMVVVMAVVVSVIIFMLDQVFLWLISLLSGQRG